MKSGASLPARSLTGKRLVVFPMTRGYLVVAIFYGGKEVQKFLHHLVIEAFGPPKPFPKALARHFDDDRLNNAIGNLRWGTQVENLQDAARNGHMRLGERHHGAKLTYEKADAIRAKLAAGASLSSLGREYGVDPSTIRDIKHGKTWVQADPARSAATATTVVAAL